MNAFNGTMTDEECFSHEQSIGVNLENDSYVELFRSTAKEILSITKAKSFIDLGGGVGAYTKAMLEQGVECTYYDLSKIQHKYASERLGLKEMYCDDFTTKKLPKVDLMASIEVMEHIEDAKLIPFLKSAQCNYFHFSSTPERTDFDEQWGHINIKSESEWIELFTKCGLKFEQKISLPTTWSLLFSK